MQRNDVLPKAQLNEKARHVDIIRLEACQPKGKQNLVILIFGSDRSQRERPKSVVGGSTLSNGRIDIKLLPTFSNVSSEAINDRVIDLWSVFLTSRIHAYPIRKIMRED